MGHHDDDEERGNGLNRRHALECMIWAGTGIMWTLVGGVPKSLNLLSEAQAAEAVASGFTFLQISDSHVGFDKEAKVTAIDTLNEAIDKVKALTMKPSFMIHTGDITHLSKADQFDDATQIIGSTGIVTHYVPGEHDVVDAGQGKAYMDRYGKDTWGQGWYSFDENGVHFIGLVNVVNLKAGGLGFLGPEQLDWLQKDLAGRPSSQPIVVFAHIEDYRDILIPRAEALMGTGKLKMLYALDSEVSGFELEAIWDDARFGARHWSGFDAMAVVTDIGCIRAAVTMFTPFIPARVKLFGIAEMAQAKQWIVGAP